MTYLNSKIDRGFQQNPFINRSSGRVFTRNMELVHITLIKKYNYCMKNKSLSKISWIYWTTNMFIFNNKIISQQNFLLCWWHRINLLYQILHQINRDINNIVILRQGDQIKKRVTTSTVSFFCQHTLRRHVIKIMNFLLSDQSSFNFLQLILEYKIRVKKSDSSPLIFGKDCFLPLSTFWIVNNKTLVFVFEIFFLFGMYTTLCMAPG